MDDAGPAFALDSIVGSALFSASYPMTATVIALASAGCIFAGTLLGLTLRRFVPDHHLNADSKDAIKVGALRDASRISSPRKVARGWT